MSGASLQVTLLSRRTAGMRARVTAFSANRSILNFFTSIFGEERAGVCIHTIWKIRFYNLQRSGSVTMLPFRALSLVMKSWMRKLHGEVTDLTFHSKKWYDEGPGSAETSTRGTASEQAGT